MNTMNLSTLRRRYVYLTALTWLPIGLTLSLSVLIMTERGLGLATIGAVFVVHGVVVTSLELPTGGLADTIGRSGVLTVSAAFGAVALVWMATATHPWEFAALTVLRGVARALSTGPAEAWYVDSAHTVDPDAPIRSGLAAGEAASSITLGVGTVVGGAIPLFVPLPTDGLITPLSIPILIAAGCYLALLATAVWGMPEPPRHTARSGIGNLIRGVPATVVDGLRLGFRDRVLRRVLTTIAAVGAALYTVELLTPGRIADLAGGSSAAAGVYGVVTAFGFAASATGASLSSWVARRVGAASRAAVIGVAVAATGLVTLFATGSLTGVAGIVATGIGYGIMFVGLGLAGPVRSEIIHRRVTSTQRATVISVQSLVQQSGGLVGAVGLPLVAVSVSLPAAWLLAGLLLLASAVLFRRVDVAVPKRTPEAERPVEPDAVGRP